MNRISADTTSGEIHIGNYVERSEMGAIAGSVRLRLLCGGLPCDTIDYDVHPSSGGFWRPQRSSLPAGWRRTGANSLSIPCSMSTTELAWIFNCVTPVGELERMTQFKEKGKLHRQNVNVGLLDIGPPAADILIYKAGFVPVERIRSSTWSSRERCPKFNAVWERPS